MPYCRAIELLRYRQRWPSIERLLGAFVDYKPPDEREAEEPMAPAASAAWARAVPSKRHAQLPAYIRNAKGLKLQHG